jgi:trigger factor
MALQIRSEIKDLSSVERELAIVVPGDTVAKELDRAYKELSMKVKLKGFRPGKVPRYVLEQYYKK